MAYRRRYYEPFVGTTETIADDAITEDKIGDKSVGTPQLKDDAITSEKIADGEVKSEDIGSQQVKTSDIADGAVTEEKLDVSVPTRPLTPGVATAEIADLAVTEAKLGALAVATAKIKAVAVTEPKIAGGSITPIKLAANAVETAKIKDGAVTGAKIDTDTIENVNIKASAVRGPEIQDGAVSTSELATDSVETVKIKDLNVTAPKLAADAIETIKIKDGDVTAPKLADEIMDALFGRRPVFYDDFFGSVLSDRWTAAGDVGGTVDLFNPHMASIASGAVLNDAFHIDWNASGRITTSVLPKMTTKLNGYTTTDIYILVALYVDADNYIGFRLDTSVDNNWRAVCRKAAAETVIDTGLDLAGRTTSKFKIDVTTDGAEVKFYIDGALVATINTNVLAAESVEPRFEVKNLTTVIRFLRPDYVTISEDRA